MKLWQQANKLNNFLKKVANRLYDAKVRKINDYQHKVSKTLGSTYDTIYAEDLSVKSISEGKWTNLNRSIRNAKLAQFLSFLGYKTNHLVSVNPRNTSKTCNSCGKIHVDLKLSDRTITCSCGKVYDRDENAANNIFCLGQAMMDQPSYVGSMTIQEALAFRRGSSPDSEHASLHSQLEHLAFNLVQNGLILFDKNNKKYVLSPAIQLQTLERSFGFEDIAIKQKKNICQSRLEVDISSEIIRGIKRNIPIIAANMSTVVNAEFCIQLFKLGALGILHRADTKSNILSSIAVVSKECDIVAASIGIEEDQFDFAKEMIRAGCNVITIDVAHGYSDKILELGKRIKKFDSHTKIILGNTTNTQLMYECYDFADAVKVGIAQGLACETKNTAGCTEKQFSAVLKFKQISKDFGIPIISDGGIREPADFTKAIAAGANSVMAGSIFAACPESAAPFEYLNGIEKKLYAGMASRYVQDKWKGGLKAGTCPEGGVRYLDVGEPLDNLLERYSGALKSGITYAGSNNINSFQNNAEFVLLR